MTLLTTPLLRLLWAATCGLLALSLLAPASAATKLKFSPLRDSPPGPSELPPEEAEEVPVEEEAPPAEEEVPPAEAEPPAPAAIDPAGSAPPGPAGSPPRIELNERLRFVIRPTLLGLVPLDDAAGYGECFARVASLQQGRLSLYYEIKELAPGAAPAAPVPAAPVAAPPVAPGRDPRLPALNIETTAPPPPPPPSAEELDPATRIRRGEIAADLNSAARSFAPPLCWGDGSWQAQGGLLWLPESALQELRTRGRTAWGLDWEAGGLALDAPRQLSLGLELLAALGADGSSTELLVSDYEALYPVVVNGARERLPALRCTDSLGLAEYWILNEPGNPLLLKLTLLPDVRVGLAFSETAGELERLRARGAGFAITIIDF